MNTFPFQCMPSNSDLITYLVAFAIFTATCEAVTRFFMGNLSDAVNKGL